MFRGSEFHEQNKQKFVENKAKPAYDTHGAPFFVCVNQ
jgi:hypothetical protein